MPPDREFVLAIDGPAAAGKSSTARAVAERLQIRRADSGALYRAATAAALRSQPDPATWTEESVLEGAQLVGMVPVSGAFEVRLGGRRIDAELRSEAVTGNVSLAAAMPRVRHWVREMMRDCAATGPIVVDGRDMGTVVFPDAALKIWLIADPKVRAHRRSVERLGRLPTDDEIDAEANALQRRDDADAAQSNPADDAIEIDTTSLTQGEQVDRIVDLARERMKGRKLT